MNWLPARLTWLVMTLAASLLAGTSARKAFRVGWQQHALVPGPNSGWSEAATAGGIQRRLVGPLWRDGALVTTIWLGDPCDPEAGSAEDFLTACRFILVVCALWVAATAVFLAS